MKANVSIQFLEVSGKKVDKKLESDKQFRKSTEKTIRKLCEQIEKYFRDFKVETGVTYKVV